MEKDIKFHFGFVAGEPSIFLSGFPALSDSPAQLTVLAALKKGQVSYFDFSMRKQRMIISISPMCSTMTFTRRLPFCMK